MRKQRPKSNVNGRTRRNRGIGYGESSNGSANRSKNDRGGVRDPYKNGEIPLCRLLKEAIEDIFPELKDEETSIHVNRSQPQSSQTESSSIFGQMIRRKFLLSRKSLRASLDASTNQWSPGEDCCFEHVNSNRNGDSGNLPIDPPKPALTTAARKRRKKKKKKRQSSSASLPPTIIAKEIYTKNNNEFDAATFSPPRNGIGSLLSDGKSMMSTADHSLEALDEAVKMETEKLNELEANHERPLLESLPSDDNISAQESPSQFIDQIKPQEETPLQLLPHHVRQLPLTDPLETTILPSSLPADTTTANEDGSEILYKMPLRLPFLVNAQSRNFCHRNVEKDNEVTVSDGKVSEELRNLTTCTTDKERTRLLLHEWIDQIFFMNDESEVASIPIAKDDAKDDLNHDNDEWASFIEFCNERTVGKEKALGIPYDDLLSGGTSIDCRFCRDETLLEIKKIGKQDTHVASAEISTKSSRLVMEPKLLEKPSPQSDEEMNIETAFDYVALEEGNHIMNKDHDEHLEKSDFNLSFLAIDVATDSKKRSTNKNDSSKKVSAGNVVATEQHFFLETITLKKLEEFLYEWLIVGVDDEKISQTSIRQDIGQRENENVEARFPIGISKDELQWVQKRVDETQGCIKKCLDTMIVKLEEIPAVPNEMNVDHHFTAMNTMENCEESCNEYYAEYILPILTRDFTIPSDACAELQFQVWTLYLEVLGKTLNACDAYYKKLEEDVAQQNGTLPMFVLSKDFRTLYRQHSEEKIGYLSEIGKTLSKATISLPMREYHTRTFWKQCKPNETTERSEKLDEDCRNLIRSLTEWTRIVNGPRMSVINKERTSRLLNVFNMLRVVAESLGQEYDTVKRHFSQERQKYFAWLLSSIFLAHGVKSRMRLVEMDDVVGLTTGVILMWRHVRIMQSRVGKPTSAEILPLSLLKWAMESHDSADAQGVRSFVFTKCLPGSTGAKRRSMGILAGLTYIWLRERCKEWKAEIASRELLTDFETTLLEADPPPTGGAGGKKGGPSGHSSNNNKPGKKAKKKKNKNKGSAASATTANNGSPLRPVNPPSEQQPTEANHSDTGSETRIIPSVPSEPIGTGDDDKAVPVTDESIPIPVAVPIAEDVEGIPIPIDDQSKRPGATNHRDRKESPLEDRGLPDGEDTGYEEGSAVATEPDGLEATDGDHLGDFSPHWIEEEEDDDFALKPFESKVAVQDETGRRIPTMEFLTDRLLALMGQPESDKILIVDSV